MTARLSDSAGSERFWMRVLGLFAALAVFLAAIGLYGVISYAVTQQTHEFGVRTALGAQKGDILRLVVGEGFLVSVVGVAIGVVAAFGVTRLIANRLFGVTPMDPLTITAVALVLIGVALFACYIPARRATKIDPVVALGLSDTHQPSLRSEEARQCFVLAGLCSGVLGARTELSTRKRLELFETVDHAHWLPLVSATLKGCATEEVEIRTGISVVPSGLGHR